jgi:MFS family permease
MVRAGPLAGGRLELPRQFWLLTGGAFVFLVGYNMCYPFQTIYLNQRLGLSPTAVGVIIGASLLAGLPLQIVGGVAVDRFGRRPVLAFSVFSAVCLLVGLGLTDELWLVVALIAFEAACGWALFITSTNAAVADLAPRAHRDEAFSVLRVAMNAGITLGPLVAAPLLVADPSFRLAFVTGGAVVAVFLVLVLAGFRETRPPSVPVGSALRAFHGYGEVLRDRRLLVFCLVALLPLYVFGQIWVTMPIMLGDLQGVSAEEWGLVMVAYGVVLTALQYPLVRLLRSRDHLLSLALACVCLGLGVGSAAFIPWPGTFVCMAAVAVGLVLFIPISASVVAHLAPVRLRGRYMGAWTLVYMGGYALGPLLGGAAMDALGGRTAFALAAAAGLLGAALFALLRHKVHDAEDEADGAPAPGAAPGGTDPYA